MKGTSRGSKGKSMHFISGQWCGCRSNLCGSDYCTYLSCRRKPGQFFSPAGNLMQELQDSRLHPTTLGKSQAVVPGERLHSSL